MGRIFEGLCFAAATALLATLAGLLVSLFIGGWPALSTFGLKFFVTSSWNPVTDVYGAAGPIVGTLVTAFLALLLALPVAGGVAFFLTELCPAPLRRPIGTAVELLAGIPSIVYGMWGLFVFAPLFAKYVQMPLMMSAPPGSLLEKLTTGIPNGSGILSASIILAIMILPFMAATLRELLLTVPSAVRESAYGLGATTGEVVMKVTLPYVRGGAIGAVMLGLGRALGETMAVTFIIGNAHGLPASLFDSGSTIASTIANEFTEATSPVHTSALIALGLVLFVITFAVLALARLLLRRQESRL
ncbi:phosphate ABC transporter permease subunit PstC [Phenylobacterium deserti]|uniref:phosphate ABC transporter permease subunit PstC n=1 Tax=Phenylobacterium deserti TaxID=1914756 RepID=UPI001F0B9C6C|nr:phosphate ABC transporter permease subunit PstC [Phenylobacterium deserti]